MTTTPRTAAPNSARDTILVVDDDPQVTSLLKRYLEKHDFTVLCASDGLGMQRYLQTTTVNLCVLDINLPGKSGLDLTRDIRKESNLPILILSGLDETFDRVVGLEFGADDYMTKPFEPRELLARIRSILRRARNADLARVQATQPNQRLYQFGPWRVSLKERRVTDASTQVDIKLTTTEFDLLTTFVENPHTVFSRNQLLDTARGRDSFSGDRAIDVHVARLRKKLEPDAEDPKFIKTIHGIGYCFVADVAMVD